MARSVYNAAASAYGGYQKARKLYGTFTGASSKINKAGRASTAGQTSTMKTYVNPATTQTSRMYKKRRKRRVPKRKWRRLKRFRRRVIKIVGGKAPTNVYITRMTVAGSFGTTGTAGMDITWTPGNARWIGNSNQWGIWVPNGVATDDVGALEVFMNQYNTVYGNAIRNFDADRAIYKGCMVTHAKNKLSISNYMDDKSLLFDLYTFVAAQDITDPNVGNPVAAMTYLWGNHENNGGTSATMTMKGLTPFNCPKLGKFWKVLEVQRVLIPPAGLDLAQSTREFVMKGRRGWYSASRFASKQAVKGKTKYWAINMDIYNISNLSGEAQIGALAIQKFLHYRFANANPPANPVVQMATLVPPTA